MSFRQRQYQKEACDSIWSGWDDKEVRNQLLCMATGTGKTIVFSDLAAEEVKRGGRVLILAHTDELIDQAIDKFTRSTGMKCGKEKATSYASRFERVVIGSVQTMQGALRLPSWPANHFTIIIVDEAHRSLAAGYQKVLTHFISGGAKVVGVTATADRGDKRALGEFYQRVAFDYGLLKAVRDGWLVRPIVKTMPIKIDLTGVQMRNTSDGSDLDRAEVGHRIAPFLDSIAAAIKVEAGTDRVRPRPPQDVMGMAWFQYIHPDDYAAAEAWAVEGEGATVEMRLLDGRSGWIHVALCKRRLGPYWLATGNSTRDPFTPPHDPLPPPS